MDGDRGGLTAVFQPDQFRCEGGERPAQPVDAEDDGILSNVRPLPETSDVSVKGVETGFYEIFLASAQPKNSVVTLFTFNTLPQHRQLQ